MDYIEELKNEYENFERSFNATKYHLAQFNVLSESIKHSKCKGLGGPNGRFVLSSLCTKLMQLNAALERLDDVKVGDTQKDNESQTMTTATANRFIMYSILDEFKLNDSKMPSAMVNGGGDERNARNPGDIGTGFISHIENETIGLVYIVDASRTPDTLTFFGAEPKRLTQLPQPGEMFGYVFNEKYLVRAVRAKYESGIEVLQKNQYTAWLMDIGCTVVVKQTLCNHYEVTEIAKTIPAYAKCFQLLEIPDRTTVFDLLHLRIQYKVILFEDDLGFVNIQSAGANPFAVDQQNEWNFYLYYLGSNHMNGFSSHRANKQVKPTENTTARAAARKSPPRTMTAIQSPPLARPKITNPFLDGSYDVENIPMGSLAITKSNNPFFSDSTENLYETSQAKQKFVNFKFNKMLNIKPSQNLPSNKNDHPTTQQTKAQQVNSNQHTVVEEKILNGDARATNDATEMKTVDLNQSTQHASKLKTNDNRRQKHNEIEESTFNDGWRQSKPHLNGEQQQQQQPSSVSNINLKIDSDDNNNNNKSTKLVHDVTVKEPIKSSESLILADKRETRNGDSTVKSIDFPQPKNLPQVGDTIKILFQAIESLETFYATLVDNPECDMPVHEFSAMLNSAECTQQFESYGTSTPQLFDKVMALYENEYYRAKVISVIDEHGFHIFYVDYGNCAKVKTAQLFKYDSKWDKYPVYALRFRINGIEETNPWDNDARNALEQILIADCNATVVRIQYCEKTKRMTYVVDLHDENGLNVAETLVHKNLAIFIKDLPKNKLKHPSEIIET